MSAAQKGWTSATSSTIACTFDGVIVSTLPISSPVAGLKDSSDDFDAERLDETFLRDFGAAPLPPFEPDFPPVPVLLGLASIALTPSRCLR